MDQGPLFNVSSPLSWPAVVTASPTVINFISPSFCLMYGNSFPTLTWTMIRSSIIILLNQSFTSLLWLCTGKGPLICWCSYKKKTYIYKFTKVPLNWKSPRSARSRLGFRLILNSSGIEILIIQDSDPRLGTQEYFKFGVLSSNWDKTMPHFSRK